MNIVTLMNTLATAATSNAALNTWTMTQYTKMVIGYVGCDLDSPPDPSEYPVVSFFPAKNKQGLSLDRASHHVGVVCAITKDSITTAEVTVVGVETKATKKTYDGIASVDAFRVLVMAAILAAIPAGMFLENIDDEYHVINMYPNFLVMTGLEITEVYSQGPVTIE